MKKKNIRNIIIIIIIFIIIYNIYIFKSINVEKFENILRYGYVINLDERKDRYNNIIKYFEAYNMPLYRVSAIKDNVGWKGCGYSHISVIKMAKEKNLPSVLILEDDCKPTKHFKNWDLIQKWLEKNRESWDIFIGGNSYYGFWTNDKESIIPVCTIENEIKLYKTKVAAFHFYYVNSKAYDKMIEWETHITNKPSEWIPIDLWPDKQKMTSISCVPYLAFQEENYSNIENGIRSYDVQMFKGEEVLASIKNDDVCEMFKNYSTV